MTQKMTELEDIIAKLLPENTHRKEMQGYPQATKFTQVHYEDLDILLKAAKRASELEKVFAVIENTLTELQKHFAEHGYVGNEPEWAMLEDVFAEIDGQRARDAVEGE